MGAEIAAKETSVPSARSESSVCHAGRFGFQKEMNALKSLKMPNAEENHNVQALLNSTQEIEDRYKIFWRWWRVWRADVRAGWVVLGRFKVIQAPLTMPRWHGLPGSYRAMVMETDHAMLWCLAAKIMLLKSSCCGHGCERSERRL